MTWTYDSERSGSNMRRRLKCFLLTRQSSVRQLLHSIMPDSVVSRLLYGLRAKEFRANVHGCLPELRTRQLHDSIEPLRATWPSSDLVIVFSYDI